MEPNYILGISCYYHDSSAALLKDGKVVAAVQEERFTRKKHDTSFPENSIQYCLESEGITIKDIDCIGFYEKPILKFERLLYQHLQSFPKSYKTFLMSLPSWFNEKLRILKKIRKIGYKKEVLFIEHHMAHAAGSFLPSPFEKAAIVTIDGVGEWTTTSYGIGNKNKIKLIKDIVFPHSLGLLYSAMTAYLGFKVNSGEYQAMGLAPYGNMDKEKNRYYPKLKKVIDIKEDGSYRLNMKYFKYHYSDKMPSKKLVNLLKFSIRKKGEEITKEHKEIAAALQLIYEEVLFKILNHVHKKTKCDDLILAGGSGLNSVANGKILKNTPFKRFWSQPDPGDGGSSLGVALYIYNLLNKPDEIPKLNNACLGPEFSTEEIKNFLDKNKIKYTTFKDDRELLYDTAHFIYRKKVIGWFQGRMEWGPRALGNRSILANPCNPKAKELLNLKVKYRQSFRPFAPVVCEDDALTYFDCDNPIPIPTDYMLAVYPVLKEWHDKLPSITHVDGSGRLQTIRKEQNDLYYRLIKQFGNLSTIPILINTSFNIRGEPIVCTPQEAYNCVMGTGIDYLIMDKFLIKRDDNPKDMWDSEGGED